MPTPPVRKPADPAKLETLLRHAINMERKAATRVKRAASLLQKWQHARRRIERRIGDDDIRRVINRITLVKE